MKAAGFKEPDIILEPNQKGALSVNVMMEVAGLGRGVAIDGKGEGFETNTLFAGTVNGQPYQSPISLSNTDSVALSGEITVDSQHVGQTAEILIVVSYTSPKATEQFFMLGADGQVMSWDGQINSLVAVKKGLMLEKIQEVDIYSGALMAGKWHVFFGYRLEDGTIVFNGRQGLNLVK